MFILTSDSVDPPEDGDASISAASNLEETPTSLTPAASPMDVTENSNVWTFSQIFLFEAKKVIIIFT